MYTGATCVQTWTILKPQQEVRMFCLFLAAALKFLLEIELNKSFSSMRAIIRKHQHVGMLTSR